MPKTVQSKEAVKHRSRKVSNSRESLGSKEQISEVKSKSSTTRSRASTRQQKSKCSKKEEADTNEPVDEELLRLMGRALTHNQWYHGLMPRDEIEDLIKKNGDFLVRKTEVNKQPRYAVSVMSKARLRHILLSYKDGQWWLREVKKGTLTELIEYHVNEKFPVQSDGTLLISAVPRPDFYILHEHIEVKKRLGGGAFGEVFTGVWKKNDAETVDVAVKKLKGMMHKKQRADFVKEAKLMKRFDHPNIVRVFGVAPQEEPVMIVLELASGGSLQSKLKNHPDINADQLMNYCKDAARGMCYLSGRQVIHRDIAARNCLLGPKDELKISDFGLSVADTSLVKLDKLKSMPVKWLAPETLKKGEFSKKSDVWSYGVLVWEIFSRCKTDPFPGDSNAAAKQKILAGTIPMQLPEGSPSVAVAVMQLCFTQNPDERPDFEAVFKLLAPKENPPVAMDMWDTYAT